MNITNMELASRPQCEAAQRSAALHSMTVNHETGSEVLQFLQGVLPDQVKGADMDLWPLLLMGAMRMHCDCDCGCNGLSAVAPDKGRNKPTFIFQSDSGKSPQDRGLNATTADFTSKLEESLKSALCAIRKKQDPSPDGKLTARELEVLKWIGQGKSTWEISMILDRSESVIKWHVKNLLNKLSAVNRSQAVAIAVRQGLIE